jgi:hypothetical protein
MLNWAKNMWAERWEILGSDAMGGMIWGMLIAAIVWLVQI